MSSEQGEQQIIQEQELRQQEVAQWVAGLFEIGGTWSYHLHRANGVDSVEPLLRIQSRKVLLTLALYKQFGGWLSEKENRWELYGEEAFLLSQQIAPYVVSRKDHVDFFRELYSAEPGDESFEVAGRWVDDNKYDRFKDLTPGDYAKAVKSAPFVAGLIDNKGNISKVHPRYGEMPHVAVQTADKALLIALQQEYRGNLRLDTPAGTFIDVNGKKSVAERDRWSWYLTYKTARGLLHIVSPYLRIPAYEGWDIRPMDVISKKGEDKTRKVISLIEQEMEEFREGKRTRISTNPEIGEMVGEPRDSVRKRLKSLSPDIRKQRESIIERQSNASFDRQQIDSMVQDIIQEVQEYKNGQRTWLSTNIELAQAAGVSKATIGKNIVTQLPRDIAKFRFKILLSQANQIKKRNRLKD